MRKNRSGLSLSDGKVHSISRCIIYEKEFCKKKTNKKRKTQRYNKRKQKCDRETEGQEQRGSQSAVRSEVRWRTAEFLVLTPKVTVLTGMPVGPPLSLSYVFCFSQTHSCLFCCPLQVLRYRACRPLSNVNMNTHTHTHTPRRAHLSKHGGWRD